jgi:hypothetical protein
LTLFAVAKYTLGAQISELVFANLHLSLSGKSDASGVGKTHSALCFQFGIFGGSSSLKRMESPPFIVE